MWTKNCGSHPENGPKNADRTLKMDQKLRIGVSENSVFSNALVKSASHQTPPNSQFGGVGVWRSLRDRQHPTKQQDKPCEDEWNNKHEH
jgi:hypothetical protein